MTQLTPINDDLVIAIREKTDGKTESGLVLPDAAIEKPQYATVYSVSTDHTKVASGDTILIRKHSGTEVTHDGEDYIVLHINEILAVIK